MNRSILIVICDFLLVSLLAFSTVDINKVADEGTPRVAKVEIATNQVDSGKDLAAVMKLALNEERKNQDRLMGELTRSREASVKQQALLSEREKQLGERERQVQTFQQEVQTFQKELQARDQEALGLRQQQTNLQQQFATSQANIQNLNQQLQSSAGEATMSKEKLAALEAELRKQAEQAAALQRQMAQLAQSNQAVLTEKIQLAGQLQVAEAEKRFATQQVAQAQEQIKVEREEKAKLAEGVKALATKSSELAQEVRETRPLAPNTIFNSFLSNRVAARFVGSYPGLFGVESSKNRDTQTVLVTNGTNTYALCHVQDTPLSLVDPGTDWEALTGILSRGTVSLPIKNLTFSLVDPRVVLIPVPADQAQSLGGRIYRPVPDPYKFQDAVLVGAREGYYGECQFQIDLSTPDYVRMDHNSIKGLFGKFNPSRGDLVFSKNGELMGIMANSTYCMMLRNFDAASTLPLGTNVKEQHTGLTLAMLYGVVVQMPAKLQ